MLNGVYLLSEDAISKLIKAGRIAKMAIDYASKVTKPGMKLIDIATSIENYIREHGGDPAFPVNIGVNSIAAHYTPVYNDQTVLPDNSIVKIDIGVHVDGYIADTAITMTFNPVYEGLLESCRKALEKALGVVHPGMRVSEVGRILEEVIKSYGYKPIKNLSGHGIDRYTIHSGVVVPNYNDILNRHRFENGVYAIEPFATTGVGLVKEGNLVTIYALKTGIRNLPFRAREFYEIVYNKRRGLPFTTRWYIQGEDDLRKVQEAIEGLRRSRSLVEYNILVEREGGLVSQFEHTIIITKNEVIITTI